MTLCYIIFFQQRHFDQIGEQLPTLNSKINSKINSKKVRFEKESNCIAF